MDAGPPFAQSLLTGVINRFVMWLSNVPASQRGRGRGKLGERRRPDWVWRQNGGGH